jgi:hypothetical protein
MRGSYKLWSSVAHRVVLRESQSTITKPLIPNKFLAYPNLFGIKGFVVVVD